MLELDGAEGGGQLLRTALALSAIVGTPFRMTDVRGGRPEPGLRPQHLAAVRVLADICDAGIGEIDVGATELVFEPGEPRAGTYEVDIGTAGSVTLLFDAVLPLAAAIDAPLAVRARGGTDVRWSPPMAYYRRVKLPLLRRHGVPAAVDVDRPGFYPDGGGVARLSLGPAALDPLDLVDRGDLEGVRIHSLASADLADRSVAERQADAAAAGFDDADVVERTVVNADAASPGSAVVVGLTYERGIAGFDALGEPGTPAEEVAAGAVDAARTFRAGSAAVDRHLADQLVPFLGLAGGRVAIPAVTDHVATVVDLLDAFGVGVRIEERDETPVLVGADARRTD